MNSRCTYSINVNAGKTKKGQHYGHLFRRKRRKNYQAFMDELEKISKKYGIAFEGCGVFAFSDENGFKNTKYRKDSSSGDLRIDELVFSDGTKAYR